MLSPNNRLLFRLCQGSSIGESEVLHHELAFRLVTARASQECVVYSISKTALEDVLKDSDTDRERLREGALQMYSGWSIEMLKKHSSHTPTNQFDINHSKTQPVFHFNEEVTKPGGRDSTSSQSVSSAKQLVHSFGNGVDTSTSVERLAVTLIL